MVTVACALLAAGYTLFYVAASNLAHGPGHGVGFLEAIGLNTSQAAPPPGSHGPTAAGPTKPGPTRSSPRAQTPKPQGGGK